MTEPIKASIETRIVETTEQPFIPGGKRIELVLQPLPEEEPFTPPTAPVPELPIEEFPGELFLPPEKKSLVLDIETTGIMPFNSRIICISAMDVNNPMDIKQFHDLDEEKMVREFINYFDQNNFTEIIGYNVAFDYRFIFAKMMRYGIRSAKFVGADLYDLMQVMKQVKTQYVFNQNKAGHLHEWVEYFFGMQIAHTPQDILKAWKDKRIDYILDVNKKDVEATYRLWYLVNYVSEVEHG